MRQSSLICPICMQCQLLNEALLTRTHFMQLVDRLVTAITAPFHESGLMQHEAHIGANCPELVSQITKETAIHLIR